MVYVYARQISKLVELTKQEIVLQKMYVLLLLSWLVLSKWFAVGIRPDGWLGAEYQFTYSRLELWVQCSGDITPRGRFKCSLSKN